MFKALHILHLKGLADVVDGHKTLLVSVKGVEHVDILANLSLGEADRDGVPAGLVQILPHLGSQEGKCFILLLHLLRFTPAQLFSHDLQHLGNRSW